MPDNLLKSQAFRFKGRLYTLTVLQLLTSDLVFLKEQLQSIKHQAPRMFIDAPLVLDLSAIPDENLDLNKMCEAVRLQGFIPLAVQGGNAFVNTIAKALGMAVFNASSVQNKTFQDKPPIEQTESAAVSKNTSHPTKIQTNPVRSGQQVVAKGGDLIIVSAVSAGAEVLADGNIHIYGALRGRALAGLSGDKEARIFCNALEAELVSIAGFYRLSDTIKPYPGPCQLYLKSDDICIEPL